MSQPRQVIDRKPAAVYSGCYSMHITSTLCMPKLIHATTRHGACLNGLVLGVPYFVKQRINSREICSDEYRYDLTDKDWQAHTRGCTST
jgi:hypothetical protein